jgi:hypothetical protein
MRVIARIYGGLGNQLFMYAFARRVALAHDAELVLDTTSGFTRDPYHRDYALQHFDVAGRPASDWESYADRFGIPRRRAARLVNRLLPAASRWYLHEESQGYNSRVLTRPLRQSVYLEGYWQLADHAEAIADVLREDLSFRWQPGAVLRQSGLHLRGYPSVCVHVRRFRDESASSGKEGRELPPTYYQQAIEHIRRKVSDADFYVFTDTPDCPLVKQLVDDGCRLAGDGGASGSPIGDFWLMTQCQHFVVANSTYSWWAAWLGRSAFSVIVSPARVCDIMNLSFTCPPDWLSVRP